MKLSVFLPCRLGSQRVLNKNTRSLGNYENGLIENKLKQLVNVKNIDEVIVSTNDSLVKEVATSFFKHDSRLVLDHRPDDYCANSTTTDALIQYVSEKFSLDHVLWTHVTSPFIDSKLYEDMIATYIAKRKEGYDSLMSVKPLRSFLWNENGPVNYQRSKLKWPMTQSLPTYFEVDSGVFLAPHRIYNELSDRIGNSVYLYENSPLASFDVDWEDDFSMAEHLINTL